MQNNRCISYLAGFLFLFYISFLPLESAHARSKEIQLKPSRLLLLAEYMKNEEPDLQYEFARIALIEMYNSFEDEIKTVQRTRFSDPDKRLKAYSWTYATKSFLNQLAQTYMSLDTEVPLSIHISQQNKVYLIIGNSPVYIEGPNRGADSVISQNIVQTFCERYDCEIYFIETPVTDEHYWDNDERTVTRQGESKQYQDHIDSNTIGRWNLNQNNHPQFETNTGLVFAFKNLSDRAQKEQVCYGIMDEVRQLLEVLKEVQRKNQTIIDFVHLRIEPLPLTDREHKVIVSEDGYYVKLYLPYLGKNVTVVNELIPWLETQLSNEKTRTVKINAEKLL